MFRFFAVCAVLSFLATSPASSQVSENITVPPIDFQRWARFVVRDMFDTQPHERYVLMMDPSYYPELVDALRAEFMEVHAVELGTILFDGVRVAERRRQIGPRASDTRYRTYADEAMQWLYEEADIFLWLPYRYSVGSERGDRRLMEHMVEGTRVRGLHLHWVQGLGRLGQDDVNTLSEMYARALDIDYDALSAHQDRIIGAMRDREIRITTPFGTDLRMHIPTDAWFHKNDGRLDRAKAARARSVRDRQMELPAGALRFIPDVTSVGGVLAVPSWRGGRNVRFTFRNGLVTSVSAEENEQAVRDAWRSETGDKDRIAELVIGTNPVLPIHGPGTRPPYYGYGAGALRIALGENWESGGTNRSSMEAWFYFTDASVSAGDVRIVRDGELVLR